MASHGDRENLIHFTLVMKDYDEVIENNITNGQYQAGIPVFFVLKKLLYDNVWSRRTFPVSLNHIEILFNDE